ncbi:MULTISPECIES: hypothetical protein [unclassified Streptomyces]|uniref:hypothetical protein n=1 Tax=unclassified Streptomyces TaxID=2593676 RepID=UPI003D718B27
MGMKTKIAVGAVVGAVVIGVVSATAGDDGDGSKDSAGKGTTSSAAPTPGKKKDADGDGKSAGQDKTGTALSGDGDYEVGMDIKPGTYRSTGNTDDLCYWERAKDSSGEADSILANDNVTGTSYVTIKPTDKLFKTSDCSDWEAVDPKVKGTGNPATKMAGEGGMFKVGVDIAPGTYKSTGNSDDSCYWERSKDAEYGDESIIANDNVNGSAVVTLSASDGYFTTSGCQDWVKTG